MTIAELIPAAGELAPAAAVVLVASILQACTGFGFSVLATPFLLLVYDAQEAIQINIILSILISLWLVPRIASTVDRQLFRRLVAGSVLGSAAGIALFVYADAATMKITIGLILLGFTGLIIASSGFGTSARRDHMVGGLSGALTSGLGMPGPPLLVYFAGARIEKSVLRGTTLAYFLFIYSLSLALQSFFASSTVKIWMHAAILTPVTLVGVYLGNRLFDLVDQKLFMRVIQVILVATGLYLVLASA